ncbi:MAG: chromate transporter [Lachnospiraceae bacterium]|jgi:chromate transporter|uniref:chromate transporter n=1 Tax=Candidatus Merdisoma sp. JLR.KK011 TaxID=3114299 RepID=UPI00143526A7|nr:chromate transporter [Lachnospiraceae bacterium]MCI9251451.1 chromate transporter [Lachnospiraceae bacterium]MCI9382763.1 chromate transporter [Lachnospiraceae bacterium]MCI9623580.1 chromate transporter [Lachnospiraceae bacterium]GFI08849.1 putative chromate transport protein [Lachnospiraceae bacterium]
MKVLLQLYTAWFKMGLFTFGGGYAMLPMIQREVIEKYHWATEDEIMDYYAIGQCTPGIIAVNTATFVGYYQKGVLGGIAATLGVVSPSVIIIGLIASLISNFAELAVVQHALLGINVAVCVLMIEAITNLWKKSIKNIAAFCVFAMALLLSALTSVSTVWLVILSGALGILMSKAGWLKHE